MARKPKATCPVCGRPPSAAYSPFCTARCKEVDLGRWLSGVYRVPGPPAELDDDPPPGSDTAA